MMHVGDSPIKLNVTWSDLIGPHSWLRENNSRIGMTPDPSSLVKGLARQTNVGIEWGLDTFGSRLPHTLGRAMNQTLVEYLYDAGC